ncbi:MAG: tetratricopeptide repeat protein, partial [Candidatus Cloacimonetes bacterium]|nr:tetratricopeptide repeat protein [Candidatus Cloacimonadota bacterium]
KVNIKKVILTALLFSLTLQLLFCSSAAVAKKNEPAEGVRVAVWGFHYNDLDSRTMCNKYLPSDFQEVGKENPGIFMISEKDVDKALGKTKVEALDQSVVADFAKKVDSQINIWGNVSQIESTLFNMIVFIYDVQTSEIKYEQIKVEKKKEERQKAVQKVFDIAIEMCGSAETKAMEIAMNFFNSEQYTDARQAFLNVLDLNSEEKEAYLYLAYISALEGDYPTAIDYYNNALEIDPEYIIALEGLAWSYKMIEDYDMANETYRTLADIEEGNIDYVVCIGEICSITDNFDDAVDAYEEALEINPDCLVAHKPLGILYFEEDMYDEAIPHLRAVVDAGVEDSDIEKKLAIAYQKTGRIDEAVQQNLDIIERNPKAPAPYLNLAAIYVTQQDFAKALDALNTYIELMPESAIGYNRIADVYRQMKEYDKAIQFAQKSAEIAPGQPEPYLILGEIDNERGYQSYQLYVDYDEKAKNAGGDEYIKYNDLRKVNKKEANAYFTSAKDYYEKANSLTSDYFMQERLNDKVDLVNQLIEETKHDPFYDE